MRILRLFINFTEGNRKRWFIYVLGKLPMAKKMKVYLNPFRFYLELVNKEGRKFGCG
jgi:hypothetical protein